MTISLHQNNKITTNSIFTVRSRCGRISQGELRKSNLVEVFNTVDEEEDINKVGFVECVCSPEHAGHNSRNRSHTFVVFPGGLSLPAARLSSRIFIVVTLPRQ